jgi:hypothetical protein
MQEGESKQAEEEEEEGAEAKEADSLKRVPIKELESMVDTPRMSII